MDSSRQYWKRRKNDCFRNIEIRNSLSEWYKTYNLCKFQIDSLQIEVRTSFFVWQKFFRTFIKIRNIEMRNRLLWVRWYHGNSTFPPYWNAKMPSFAQYELIKPRERPAIWCISTFPWYHITQRGCCEFQYCGNTHFPAISILSGQNHIIVQGCACLFFVNCELTL